MSSDTINISKTKLAEIIDGLKDVAKQLELLST